MRSALCALAVLASGALCSWDRRADREVRSGSPREEDELVSQVEQLLRRGGSSTDTVGLFASQGLSPLPGRQSLQTPVERCASPRSVFYESDVQLRDSAGAKVLGPVRGNRPGTPRLPGVRQSRSADDIIASVQGDYARAIQGSALVERPGARGLRAGVSSDGLIAAWRSIEDADYRWLSPRGLVSVLVGAGLHRVDPAAIPAVASLLPVALPPGQTQAAFYAPPARLWDLVVMAAQWADASALPFSAPRTRDELLAVVSRSHVADLSVLLEPEEGSFFDRPIEHFAQYATALSAVLLWHQFAPDPVLGASLSSGLFSRLGLPDATHGVSSAVFFGPSRLASRSSDAVLRLNTKSPRLASHTEALPNLEGGDDEDYTPRSLGGESPVPIGPAEGPLGHLANTGIAGTLLPKSNSKGYLFGMDVGSLLLSKSQSRGQLTSIDGLDSANLLLTKSQSKGQLSSSAVGLESANQLSKSQSRGHLSSSAVGLDSANQLSKSQSKGQLTTSAVGMDSNTLSRSQSRGQMSTLGDAKGTLGTSQSRGQTPTPSVGQTSVRPPKITIPKAASWDSASRSPLSRTSTPPLIYGEEVLTAERAADSLKAEGAGPLRLGDVAAAVEAVLLANNALPWTRGAPRRAADLARESLLADVFEELRAEVSDGDDSLLSFGLSFPLPAIAERSSREQSVDRSEREAVNDADQNTTDQLDGDIAVVRRTARNLVSSVHAAFHGQPIRDAGFESLASPADSLPATLFLRRTAAGAVLGRYSALPAKRMHALARILRARQVLGHVLAVAQSAERAQVSLPGFDADDCYAQLRDGLRTPDDETRVRAFLLVELRALSARAILSSGVLLQPHAQRWADVLRDLLRTYTHSPSAISLLQRLRKSPRFFLTEDESNTLSEHLEKHAVAELPGTGWRTSPEERLKYLDLGDEERQKREIAQALEEKTASNRAAGGYETKTTFLSGASRRRAAEGTRSRPPNAERILSRLVCFGTGPDVDEEEIERVQRDLAVAQRRQEQQRKQKEDEERERLANSKKDANK